MAWPVVPGAVVLDGAIERRRRSRIAVQALDEVQVSPGEEVRVAHGADPQGHFRPGGHVLAEIADVLAVYDALHVRVGHRMPRRRGQKVLHQFVEIRVRAKFAVHVPVPIIELRKSNVIK